MNKFFLIVLLCCLTVIGSSAQDTPAFPTAEGFGKYTQGGRGGVVVAVTNTEDYLPEETPVEGSLRWALTQHTNKPVTIVFRTSGTINLKSDLRAKRNYLTIAGQTAPGDGIFIRGGKLNFGGSNHLIIRHIRSRIGLTDDGGFIDGGAIGIENASNFIIDHCTFGWSGEENMTIYDNKLTTVQWCIVHEGLYDSGHGKGVRGYGAQWGGETCTYHHNLLAHNYSRSPRINGARSNDRHVIMDFVNNVNYNWGKVNAAYGGDLEPGARLNPNTHRANMINNYYKPGPARPGSQVSYFIQSSFHSLQKEEQIAKWYMSGNVIEGTANRAYNDNNYLGIDASGYTAKGISATELYSDTLFPTPYPVHTETALEAYESVLNGAGAFPRDTIDRRIIHEVRTGTATAMGTRGAYGIIDNPLQVEGYIEYKTYNTITDADNDGMDDAWEIINGLNPADPADRNLVTLSGYTVLEVYLNSLVGEDIPLEFGTGITETKIRNLHVFPTLTSEFIQISAGEPLHSARIYSITGMKVFSASLEDNMRIDVQHLIPGVYMLQIVSADGSSDFQRFIRQ